MQKALVSVTGLDKTGIIAKVSGELYDLDINILDITQTIMGGYFTMLMIVDLQNAKETFANVAVRLKAVGDNIGVAIHIQLTDIFDAMHRI